VPSVEGIEEEQLVAARVELRQNNRAAERGAGGVVAIKRLRDTVLVVEEIVRVEPLVPLVPVRAALELLRSRLGNDVDHRAAVASVFGAIIIELDLHLADCVEVDRAAEDLRAAQIVADDAVDRHGVPSRA